MLASPIKQRNGIFKLKRPLITTNGFITDVDPIVKEQLDELNMLLSKKVFVFAAEDEFKIDAGVTREAAGQPANGGHKKGSASGDNLRELLRLRVQTKLVGEDHKGEKQWPENSLLSRLYAESPGADKLTLGECIDKTGELASLKYDYQNRISSSWAVLDFNTKTVLSYDGITDYLIAYAFFRRRIEDVNGLVNFILSNTDGVRQMINYTIVSSARAFINREKLNVEYNKDTDLVIKNILAANVSLTNTFRTSVDRIVDQQIYNGRELKLIQEAKVGQIPPEIIPQLIKYIKRSPVPITEDNVNYFLPLFITQIRSSQPDTGMDEDVEVTVDDDDFEVERFVDDRSTVQISESNVECAAQLFYSMTLGDELDIFNVVNFFTHKYMVRGNIHIQDRQLRDDLQLYVFSNRFIDTKTKKILDRTRLPERQMFYKQVFNYGNAQTTDDVIVNREFPKLWRILITEAARYLEYAKDSPHPDMFVSRQPVMQAVEDLQYNLSTNCTGMANVISPIIYKELHFVVKRIFMHPEIMRQVVPAGGSWWKVVETIHSEMKQAKPRTTVLNNKANLGYDIIKSIATYNPSTFEEDSQFSSFISNVDAYIITQAQLQDDEEDRRRDLNGTERTAAPEQDDEPAPAASGSDAAGNDEWDF
jgi:hypothetical protein